MLFRSAKVEVRTRLIEAPRALLHLPHEHRPGTAPLGCPAVTPGHYLPLFESIDRAHSCSVIVNYASLISTRRRHASEGEAYPHTRDAHRASTTKSPWTPQATANKARRRQRGASIPVPCLVDTAPSRALPGPAGPPYVFPGPPPFPACSRLALASAQFALPAQRATSAARQGGSAARPRPRHIYYDSPSGPL